jgi:hypothetical protein
MTANQPAMATAKNFSGFQIMERMIAVAAN